MNANIRFIFLGLFISVLSFSSALAQDNDEELELYPDDFSDACVADGLQIRATIEGVTAVGIMKLELYNSEDGFLSKKGRLRSIRDKAEDGPMMMCINVPEAGTYALAGYHDLDGNRKLKKKWNFTPKEPFVLSNNIEFKSLRMPKFEEAAFEVGPQGADIVINVVDLQDD
ncbi:DUF2141 domain-containing protein [Fretibacter rubidus]|uniref:DUF2141 domain-containing protein n=1 Tax=Fretibacter rubidus TaxID=570162 RepID=UPI00352B0CC0